MNKTIIPIFYAADENYMPYLAVALAALKERMSDGYEYHVHVLYSGKINGAATKVKEMEEGNLFIHFEDVSDKIAKISDCMHCRDYYTSAIYYRLFIPELFPQYKKVIYMDCDTIALSDVAELYLTDIGDCLIGAVADQAVGAVEAFKAYTKYALEIDAERYFNSGVIVMNLVKFREMQFYDKFHSVLRSYNFTIAPDQDVLNLLCKDKVYYYGAEWNQMPIAGTQVGLPKLIHYNLTMKPWHYDGILYEEYFWAYAAKTVFLDVIKEAKANFTADRVKRDEEGSVKLVALAQAEAENPHNFIRSVGI